MVRILVVGGQYEIGMRKPLVRMADGVSLLRSPRRRGQEKAKKIMYPTIRMILTSIMREIIRNLC